MIISAKIERVGSTITTTVYSIKEELKPSLMFPMLLTENKEKFALASMRGHFIAEDCWWLPGTDDWTFPNTVTGRFESVEIAEKVEAQMRDVLDTVNRGPSIAVVYAVENVREKLNEQVMEFNNWKQRLGAIEWD